MVGVNAVIIWGTSHVERQEELGQFQCPGCQAGTQYCVLRTYAYFHVYFIPLFRQQLLSEVIVCTNCARKYPISVLAVFASSVRSRLHAGEVAGPSIADSLGNVVELTTESAAEIRRRHTAGRFKSDVLVRVRSAETRVGGYTIEFDYALADGQDWIGQSLGIPILVDRRDAPQLVGKTIDYRDGRFCDEVMVR